MIDIFNTLSDNMSNNYSQMIAKGMGCEIDEICDVCLCISTIDMDYNFSFIECETEDILGIQTTVEDGTERFVILNKDHIVSVNIVYQQDFDLFEGVEEENPDAMYI